MTAWRLSRCGGSRRMRRGRSPTPRSSSSRLGPRSAGTWCRIRERDLAGGRRTGGSELPSSSRHQHAHSDCVMKNSCSAAGKTLRAAGQHERLQLRELYMGMSDELMSYFNLYRKSPV